MSAPAVKKIPHTWHRPTGDVDDPFAWLRDRDDPDTIAYLEAENAYAADWFADTSAAGRHDLRRDQVAVQETDLSVPVRTDGWWYVTRTEEGQSYPVYCRGRSAESAADDSCSTRTSRPPGTTSSTSARSSRARPPLLAWSADTDGSEHYTLRIRDLETGTDLADELVDTSRGAVPPGRPTASDLFYARPTTQMRPYEVWRHRLGTPQSDDELVYHEDRTSASTSSVGCDAQRRWIVIDSGSKLSTEEWLIPRPTPTPRRVVVAPRRADVEYDSTTGATASSCSPTSTPTTSGDDSAARRARRVDRADRPRARPAHHRRRAVRRTPRPHEWNDAQPAVRIVTRSGERSVLDFGDEPHDVELGANPEWDTTTLRCRYQSLTTPLTIYDDDVATGERTLRQADADAQRRPHRLHVGARVGDRTRRQRVPSTSSATSTRRSTAPPRASSTATASYESSVPPWFSVARLSLLDRGWIWALVHPRGGGELGRQWYLDGKLLTKRNTFTDTIAAAEHLVAPAARRPTGWRSAAAAPAACSSARA